MASLIEDQFTRTDNVSLGSEWNEFDEVSNGIRIISNTAAILGGRNVTVPLGYALYKTILEGTQIYLEWSAKRYQSSVANAQIWTFARSSSYSNINTTYTLKLAHSSGLCKLYRRKDSGNTELGATPDLALTSDYQTYKWEIENLSDRVQHKLYLDGVLKYTIDDLSADRIIADGYAGLYMHSYKWDAANRVHVDWFKGVKVGLPAYPTNRLKKDLISGFHVFLNQYIKAKILDYEPLKLPDGTVF